LIETIERPFGALNKGPAGAIRRGFLLPQPYRLWPALRFVEFHRHIARAILCRSDDRLYWCNKFKLGSFHMRFRLQLSVLLAAATTAIVPVLAAEDSAKSMSVTSSPEQRVPTEVFGKQPSLQGIRISPDGNRMLFQKVNDGREYLAVMDLATKKTELIAATEEFREAGDRTAGSWRWVGNDSVVITVLSREIFFGSRGDVSRLVAYDVPTKKVTQLAWDGAAGYASGILHIDHDRSKILVERNSTNGNNESWDDPEVIEVDVKTGKFTYVMRTNPLVGGWATDSSGVVRMGQGSDSDSGKERILYRSGNTGYVKTVANEADKNFTDAGVKPQFFLDEPDMAIISSNHDGLAKLYKVNMTKPKENQQPIFDVKGYDVGGVVTSFGGKRVIGYTYTDSRDRVKYTDPLYQELLTVLEAQFGKGAVTIFNSDRKEQKFAIFVARPNQYGTFYMFDTVSGNLQLVGYASDGLKDRKLNPVSSFWYKASDGENIEAILTMPRHRKNAKNLPMVIITHGGPFGPRDSVAFDPWAQSMAELGYVVVQPNYRGSGGYGPAWVKKGRDNGFGLRMQDDLDDVITHMATQGTVDPKRVCMMGWSYGGYASARAAQRNPDKYRCTIAGAGVYDLQLMREYDKGYLGNFGSNYLAKGATELDVVSPARNGKGKWAPIMIVHGVRDQRVPVAQARVLVSALKNSGKVKGVDYDYLEQPKNTHNLPYDDVHIEWLKSAESWLKRWNPAYVATDVDKEPAAASIASK
jgi:dipeptidyl aminopeptidase/acylaminoacyl peptidase